MRTEADKAVTLYGVFGLGPDDTDLMAGAMGKAIEAIGLPARVARRLPLPGGPGNARTRLMGALATSDAGSIWLLQVDTSEHADGALTFRGTLYSIVKEGPRLSVTEYPCNGRVAIGPDGVPGAADLGLTPELATALRERTTAFALKRTAVLAIAAAPTSPPPPGTSPSPTPSKPADRQFSGLQYTTLYLPWRVSQSRFTAAGAAIDRVALAPQWYGHELTALLGADNDSTGVDLGLGGVYAPIGNVDVFLGEANLHIGSKSGFYGGGGIMAGLLSQPTLSGAKAGTALSPIGMAYGSLGFRLQLSALQLNAEACVPVTYYDRGWGGAPAASLANPEIEPGFFFARFGTRLSF